MTLHSLIPHRSVFRAPLAHPGLRAFWPVDFERFFEEAFGNSAAAQAEASFTPRIDVHETDAAYVVCADLPGLEEKDIQVSVEEGVLSIQGKLEAELEEERKGLRYAERRTGSFQRTVELPGELVEDKVSASYKQGVLTVTLPKRPVPKPQSRSIPITTA
jgi:HSP20 family protein